MNALANPARAELHAAAVARKAAFFKPAVRRTLPAPPPVVVTKPVPAPTPPWFNSTLRLDTSAGPVADAHVRAYRAIPTVHPPIALIIAAASRASGVSQDDIYSTRRTAKTVAPRQVAMFLAGKLTPLSLPEIGRRFGGRDHTTVLHAARKIEARQAEDPYAGLIASVRADVSANHRRWPA